MTLHRSTFKYLLCALILVTGVGIALALPWLADISSLAAHYSAPAASGPCYATFNDGATYYNTMDASAVQAAVDEASPGDVVKLAGTCEGVSARGGLLQTVYISKSLSLQGGHTETDWTLDPDPGTFTTTLNADRGGRVVVISGTVEVTLNNLYVTGGHADDGGGIWSNGSMVLKNSIVFSNTANKGGGVFNDTNSSPVIEHVVFENNSADWGGGGIFNTENNNLVMKDTAFTDNGSQYGGGMYNGYKSQANLIDVTFTENGGKWGGGIFNGYESSMTLTNAFFFINSADYGGGVFNELDTSPTITNVTFKGNNAPYGGGVYNDLGTSPRMTNILFAGNLAKHGGGIYNGTNSTPLLINVSLSGNKAAEGGGLYNARNTTTLINATISGNSATDKGGGMFVEDAKTDVLNSIIWNNQTDGDTGTILANITKDSSSVISLTHSLVEGSGGSTGWALGNSYENGGGNIDKNPKFITPVDPATALTTDGNLRLKGNSPAVDAGNNAYVVGVPTDLDGVGRVVDGDQDGMPTVDMGAYEIQKYRYLPMIFR